MLERHNLAKLAAWSEMLDKYIRGAEYLRATPDQKTRIIHEAFARQCGMTVQ